MTEHEHGATPASIAISTGRGERVAPSRLSRRRSDATMSAKPDAVSPMGMLRPLTA